MEIAKWREESEQEYKALQQANKKKDDAKKKNKQDNSKKANSAKSFGVIFKTPKPVEVIDLTGDTSEDEPKEMNKNQPAARTEFQDDQGTNAGTGDLPASSAHASSSTSGQSLEMVATRSPFLLVATPCKKKESEAARISGTTAAAVHAFASWSPSSSSSSAGVAGGLRSQEQEKAQTCKRGAGSREENNQEAKRFDFLDDDGNCKAQRMK